LLPCACNFFCYKGKTGSFREPIKKATVSGGVSLPVIFQSFDALSSTGLLQQSNP
jgi:hypothetical protein